MATSASPGLDRRRFLRLGSAVLGAQAVAASPLAACAGAAGSRVPSGPLFSISLAQWSLHRALQKGELDNLDFPKRARGYGIGAVEYVNSFFKTKADDADYLAELNKRCAGEGVANVLIMCDGEGALGDPDADKRTRAVENHHKWVEAAKTLGCHAIRVNAHSEGSWEEQQKLAADGLHRLCEYGDRFGIDVIVENHGGLSSNGKWLSGTLKAADHPRCGALPDFGNFRIGKDEEYDRYQGVGELMPFARGVSAKSHDFDDDGNEIHTDYRKMLAIVVVEHGWHGHIGIEYEGGKLSEDEGILATKKLLETVRAELEKAR
ncbi:MAG: TIM barrel protein [Planctomycetes bacterium]|nr:TIM barrel protein [Planctomycetota bacterium]